jgi:hypothetical protein
MKAGQTAAHIDFERAVSILIPHLYRWDSLRLASLWASTPSYEPTTDRSSIGEIVQISRAVAGERRNRAAIERELFHGQYRLLSKNDDDLPIVD